ncbi:MAG: c-type cytochrome [Gemmataceae bacterium]
MMTVCRALAFSLLIASVTRADATLEGRRPGLTATHTDTSGATYFCLEPTVALALGPGESAHPRLAPNGKARWTGYLKVHQAGEYRFAATLHGRVAITINDKPVFAVSSERIATMEGNPFRLEGGTHPFVVEFTRTGDAARLELHWQSGAFRREPLPHDVCFHDPAQNQRELAGDATRDRGRLVVEEHGCANCHGTSSAETRQGPILTQVGSRTNAGWLDRWLADPQALRPDTAMPHMFSDDTVGRSERYAVVAYLMSLGGSPKPDTVPARDRDKSVDRGRALFVSTGCAGCHTGRDPETRADGTALHGAPSTYALGTLGSKTIPTALSAYLRDPLALSPGGRMPNMLLAPAEATDLARYLCESVDGSIRSGLPPEPAGGKDWVAWGKELVISKRCVNCHVIAGLEQGALPATKLKSELVARACLSPSPVIGSSPWYPFKAVDRTAVMGHLSTTGTVPDRPAPAFAAKMALRRFNCLACHQRDGEGGLSLSLVEEMRKYEKAENAEAVVPPPLTGVGHKLLTPWMRQMLTDGKRARPWMALRMPQYGKQHVGLLPELLAALEGVAPATVPHAVAFATQKIEAGRGLVGKAGLGCISCHDFASIPNSGTRGPDLTISGQRLRYDWYRRWLEQPQRMQPGTRMPQVFSEGKSSLITVFGGDQERQSEAMWAYCSLGPNAPLPDGLDLPKGLAVTVGSKPVVLRTFMPDAGSRAIAVGYPGGVSAVFDAATGRLAYAWTGNFLDAAPVWAGRGGNPAKALGPRFWDAPAGPPWGVGSLPPDFAARGKDPAFGATLPEGLAFAGERGYRFLGYSLDVGGYPIFEHHISISPGVALQVTERPEPVRRPAFVGLVRHFTVSCPPGQTAWLLAGMSTAAPRVFDGAVTSTVPETGASLSADGRLVVLTPAHGRTVALQLRGPSVAWQIDKAGQEWRVLVRASPKVHPESLLIDVTVWAVPREESELLRSLLVP